MIGYEMGSSVAGVYTMADASLQWRTSSLDEENDMDGQHVNIFFLLGSSLDIKFLGQPKILRQKNWPLENSNSRFSLVYFIIIIESIIPIVVSNNFVLDWTSWPIGALLHHKVCGCHLIHFSCSPTSTDYIHTTKPRVALTNLWWNIYNIRLQSKPPLL